MESLKNKTKLNVVFISCTDNYPYTFMAKNTKFSLLARGLNDNGNDTLLVNKFYGINNQSKSGSYSINNINYQTFSNRKNKLFSSVYNLLSICKLLLFRKHTRLKNILVICDGSFLHYLLLLIWARLIGYKSSMVIHEWHVSQNLPLPQKINSYFTDYLLGFFCSSILPISEFLINKSKRFNKPIYKLPICADFELCESNVVATNVIEGRPYFVYCVSASYLDSIIFVLNSFNHIEFGQNHLVFLKLVVSGKIEDVEKVKNEISKRNLFSYVELLFSIEHRDLIYLYEHAIALLIPLNPNNLSDIARFSQKISEYLSSKRPIITTSVGEIQFYFRNNETAFISDMYDEYLYGKLMEYVLENEIIANKVGIQGFSYGKNNFDYRVLANALQNFWVEL